MLLLLDIRSESGDADERGDSHKQERGHCLIEEITVNIGSLFQYDNIPSSPLGSTYSHIMEKKVRCKKKVGTSRHI